MLEVTLTSGCAAMFDVFNNLMCITIDGNFDVSASSYDVTTMIEARPQGVYLSSLVFASMNVQALNVICFIALTCSATLSLNQNHTLIN